MRYGPNIAKLQKLFFLKNIHDINYLLKVSQIEHYLRKEKNREI